MNKQEIVFKKKLLDLGLSQTDLAFALSIPVQRVNDAICGRRWGNKYVPIIKTFLKEQASNGPTPRGR